MAQVKAVPDGYSTVTPFLNIKGANEAIEFYKKAFGAEELRRFMLPDGHVGLVELKIGMSILRVSDAVKEAPTQAAFAIYVDNADALWKRAVDAGCQVVLPIADQFFGDRFGIVKDAYGNRWSIATHIKDISEAEIGKHGTEAANIR